MSDDQNQTLLLLGALGAKMDAINERINESDRRALEMDRRSTESRARLYEKVEDLGNRTHAVELTSARTEAQVNAMGQDWKNWTRDTENRVGALEEAQRLTNSSLESIKPKVDLFSKWEQRGIGIGAALTTLGLLFGVTLATFREKFLKLFLG